MWYIDAWYIGLTSDTDRHLSIQFDACIQDLVRCVALTRLVYGDRHLKLAQAHARLAKAYFQFKGKFRKTEYSINYHLRPICKEQCLSDVATIQASTVLPLMAVCLTLYKMLILSLDVKLNNCSLSMQVGDCRAKSTHCWPESCWLSAPPSPPAEMEN